MNLDRLVKLLPLGAVFLIGLGVLRTSVYYNYFGVDIMSYLSTSEVLTLFLNDLQPLLVLFLMALVHLNISERFIEGMEKSIGQNRVEKFIRDKKWRYVIFFFIVFILFSLMIFLNWLELKKWVIYLYVFCSSQLIFFLFIRKKEEELIKNESFMNVFMGVCVVSIIPLMSLKDIRIIEKNEGTAVRLTLNDANKINSSLNFRFLGKAGANYFFYNPITKETTIYKSEVIERIEIKK